MKNIEDIVNRLDLIEAYADLIKEHVTVLKKELEGSDAPKSSARKGKKELSAREKAKVLGERQKNRMRKANPVKLAEREVRRRKKP